MIDNNPPAFQSTEFKHFLREKLGYADEKLEIIHKMFITYAQTISEENKKINLISHNDINNIWSRHFLDSIISLQLFTNLFTTRPKNSHAIDVGTGAGFPGVPISILMDDCKFTLVESIHKKALFIDHLVNENIYLKNINILTDRSELLAHASAHREKYDYSFTRALAKPAVALELLIPFLKIGGHSFFWASGQEWDDHALLKKISHILGAEVVEIRSYRLPTDDRERNIIVFEKISKTIDRYPRKVGTPDKNPLK